MFDAVPKGSRWEDFAEVSSQGWAGREVAAESVKKE
jgi:hypothetical protein